ncbi:La- protein 6 [Cichlidogyrus casuarinus]|uniref:La- protein 6 n=1 Tax=Cichlidogyrus casuarinus TaxID=1844966 RepID=A0ABD2QM26_9PLAT
MADPNDSLIKQNRMDQEEKIMKQVEYYFSDANMVNDDFLLDLSKKNSDGWVEIATIASFNKMKKLANSIDQIMEALKHSKQLVVSEETKSVRRLNPLPKKDAFSERKVVILSAIPDEEIKKIKQLETKFAEASLPPKNIRCFPPFNNVSKDMKSAFNRHKLPEKKFYTIEFHDTDQADAALKLMRGWWPSSYSNLMCKSELRTSKPAFYISLNNLCLAWKPPTKPMNPRAAAFNSFVEEGKQKQARRKPDTTPQPLLVRSSGADRPRLKILRPDPNIPVVIVTRQPLIPSGEDSVGFECGWKEKLRAAQSKYSTSVGIPSQGSCLVNQATSTSCDLEDPAVMNYVK